MGSWLRLDLFVESYPEDSAFLLPLVSSSGREITEVEVGLVEALAFLFHEGGLFLGFFRRLETPAVRFLQEVPTLKPVVLSAILSEEKLLFETFARRSKGAEAHR